MTTTPNDSGRPTLYGLYVFSHGWAKILTVMSPQGASAARQAVEAGEGVMVVAAPGRLTQYQEKRAGALDTLVAEQGIQVLSKEDWDAMKVALGAAIYL